MKRELEIKDKTSQTEGLKVAVFRQHIRKTFPHKHNSYFEIIFLTKGNGTHTIDTKEYEIKPPIIFTVRKEQVHFWDITTQPEGFVLIIKKSYIDNCLDKEIKRLISELSAHTYLFPKADEAVTIFSLLLNEYQDNKPLNRAIIDGLLKALLAKLLESATPTMPKGGNSSIFQQFMELLSKEDELTNKVNHYAKLLHTTPQNLNAICRKESGQSCTETLAEHIIHEAKRLLTYTDISVSEIAHRLDFKDNSHFSKYFKRYVKMTPIAFRNNNN